MSDTTEIQPSMSSFTPNSSTIQSQWTFSPPSDISLTKTTEKIKDYTKRKQSLHTHHSARGSSNKLSESTMSNRHFGSRREHLKQCHWSKHSFYEWEGSLRNSGLHRLFLLFLTFLRPENTKKYKIKKLKCAGYNLSDINI